MVEELSKNNSLKHIIISKDSDRHFNMDKIIQIMQNKKESCRYEHKKTYMKMPAFMSLNSHFGYKHIFDVLVRGDVISIMSYMEGDVTFGHWPLRNNKQIKNDDLNASMIDVASKKEIPLKKKGKHQLYDFDLY
ncbi:hypothetical protein FGO68_gene15151 [Halteria grandinella]|uniref:Uncharacterized protein n=1 Tax=Halteria grandinella TaxID=5974 RepID=A0A8J8NXI4_HALGN|nr:hypothetical protein FGO68_gene15151 [Halteria grandinella]